MDNLQPLSIMLRRLYLCFRPTPLKATIIEYVAPSFFLFCSSNLTFLFLYFSELILFFYYKTMIKTFEWSALIFHFSFTNIYIYITHKKWLIDNIKKYTL